MSLASDLTRIAKLRGSNGSTGKVVKASLFALGASIEYKSPVDKGRFKGNWLTAFGSADTSVSESAEDSLGQMSTKLGSFKMGEVVYFTNSLPYAMPLEYGSSEQAPSGMVRLSVRNWQSIVNKEIRRNQ